MPKQDDINEDLLNEKDYTVKEKVKEDLFTQRMLSIQATKKYKELLEAADREKKAIDPKSRSRSGDPNDKQTYWQTLKEDEHNSMYNNTVDWAYIMIGIFAHAFKLSKALHNDPIDFTHFIPYKNEIGATLRFIPDLLERKRIKDGIKDEELPEIDFKVSMDDKGHVNLDVTQNGAEADQKVIHEHMLKGVKIWLEEHKGCKWEPDPENPGQYLVKDKENKLLTNEKLKELNEEDPGRSLENLMSFRFDYPTMRKTPVCTA